jgi:hypothetical protein
MNSIYVTFILRLIHVLTAIFWLGGITVVARFLMPSGRDLGSVAAPVMTHLMQVRKLPVALLVAGWLTVLSGSALYMRAGSAMGPVWYGSGPGRIFGLGGALGVIAILIGTFGNVPTVRRMGRVGAALQTSQANAELTSEMQRLQARLGRLTTTVFALLLLAAACMAVARYWP